MSTAVAVNTAAPTVAFALPAGLDTLPQSEAGAPFPIFDLNTQEQAEMDGVPVTISAKGSDSEAWQLAGVEIERRNRQKVAAGATIDPISDLCEQLAAVSTGWTGFRSVDKKEVPFSHAGAYQVYRAAPAIRAQVLSRVTNRANFTRPSPIV